jgi:hypothetical protein
MSERFIRKRTNTAGSNKNCEECKKIEKIGKEHFIREQEQRIKKEYGQRQHSVCL